MSGARQHLAGRVAAPADAASGSRTGSMRRDRIEAGGPAEMFGDVPHHVRLKMELVARASATPAAALEPIIELLVDGSPQKRTAVITAITTNEPLREQWERTWEVLRR